MSPYPHKLWLTGPRLTGLLASIGIGMAACGSPPIAASPGGAPTSIEQARVAVKGCSLSANAVEDAWTRFRALHPFHSQEVAASEPLAGGCQVLILSEPPPGVTVATLKEIHPALTDLVPKRHPVGVDGWTEDLVGVLPPMSESDLSDLTSDLHISLFGSAYRAQLTPIATRPKWTGTLDVEVRPAEVYDWVFGPEASFLPVDGGPSRSASALLAPEQTGVYVSRAPGVVLWSLPKKEAFDAQRANVRIFGLESDLLLGAVADDDTVLVIGRERAAPVDVLPPLRFETVKLLATTSLYELQQSYERLQLFAGPLANGMDWAPILLSPALIDSEFGSVLNIADQLLKRWSMNGLIDYERFDYPDPAAWAFSKPISQLVGGTSLTFNWNTEATGGLVEVADGRTLYWMNQTGALNVSYLPDSKPTAGAAMYQAQGRAFFARQNDPHLLRAVQYTSLFQAFRQLGVSTVDMAAEMEVRMGADSGNALLATAGTLAFQRLSTAQPSELSAAGQRLAAHNFANLKLAPKSHHAQVLDQFPPNLRAEVERQLRDPSSAVTKIYIDAVKSAAAARATATARALQSTLLAWGDPAAPGHLAVALVHESMTATAMTDLPMWGRLTATLRSAQARSKAREIGAAAAFLAAHKFDWQDAEQWRDAAAALGDVDAVEKQYRDSFASRVTASHVRTPSVVRSSGAKLQASGGHNAGSEVARLPPTEAPVKPVALARLGLDKDGVTFQPSPQSLRPLPVALGSVAVRPPPIAPAALNGGRPPPPQSPAGGWGRLPGEPSFTCGPNCVAIKRFDRPSAEVAGSATSLRHRFMIDVDGTVLRGSSTADIAESAWRQMERAARRAGAKSADSTVMLLDSHTTADEALGIAQSIHSRIARHRIDASDGYVLHHSDSAIALDGFALDRAVVSDPVRTGDKFAISITVPRKQGLGQQLFMRLSGKGEPLPGAAQQTRAAMAGGLRSPEEIAHDLKQRLGNKDGVLLLELARDALDTPVENESDAPRSHYAGTPGHTF